MVCEKAYTGLYDGNKQYNYYLIQPNQLFYFNFQT